MSTEGNSQLGNAIHILKLQKLDLTVGILVSLVVIYVFLAVIIYKPIRIQALTTSQQLQNPMENHQRSSSLLTSSMSSYQP